MRRCSQSGVVYVEMLMAFIPLFVLWLGLAQLALLGGAQLMVEHAATKAARAAIVILPDDHKSADYGGVKPNAVGLSGVGVNAYKSAPDRGRYHSIRQAAVMSLSPLSPSVGGMVAGDTVLRALSGNGVALTMAQLFFDPYASRAVGLGFLEGGKKYKSTFTAQESLATEVVYLYRCQVPIAQQLMCKSYGGLDAAHRKLIEVNGSLKGMSIVGGLRYVLLHATRTMPNQGRR